MSDISNRFLVLKWQDIKESLSDDQLVKLDSLIAEVEDYRREVGKVAAPKYWVVNQDENYADDVKAIILGHKRSES